MTVTSTLESLNLADDAIATLTYSEGCDVFHFNETEIDDALKYTSVVTKFASLVSNPKLNARQKYTGNILDYLRESGHLEDYVRGSATFKEYLSETISYNFHDLDMIEYHTEHYDHKRGFTTLTVEVDVPVSELIEEAPSLTGWKISVKTELGTLLLADSC